MDVLGDEIVKLKYTTVMDVLGGEIVQLKYTSVKDVQGNDYASILRHSPHYYTKEDTQPDGPLYEACIDWFLGAELLYELLSVTLF